MEFTCGEWVRQGFGFANPNHAAALVCALLPFCWGWTRRRWLGCVLSALLVAVLLLTFSRTGAALSAFASTVPAWPVLFDFAGCGGLGRLNWSLSWLLPLAFLALGLLLLLPAATLRRAACAFAQPPHTASDGRRCCRLPDKSQKPQKTKHAIDNQRGRMLYFSVNLLHGEVYTMGCGVGNDVVCSSALISPMWKCMNEELVNYEKNVVCEYDCIVCCHFWLW